MSISEFDIIKKYFFDKFPINTSFLKGDDCAVFSVPVGENVVTSTDILIEGRHFFSNVDPSSLGHKALIINLSDLAAMGAKPIGCLLSLALPYIDENWLEKFSNEFHKSAQFQECFLIGGNIARSNNGIFINVTVFGSISPLKILRRDAAKVGDEIWVSGTFGAPDIAYRLLSGKILPNIPLLEKIRSTLEWPNARLNLGQVLAEDSIANAAIDISDGLLQDLRHILFSSQVGANISYSSIPIDPYLSNLPKRILQESVLSGGDLYELCFTADPKNHKKIKKISKNLNIPITMIGYITDRINHLNVMNFQGSKLEPLPNNGFDHFSDFSLIKK
ncbi:MAG: thiamine-phosphate kinase [Bordetella sp.]|nr:MAG: thiamine-phosphate kinase [Bordetella sp.]